MFILMYDCPCGKKHKSRTTVHKHKKRILEASKEPPKSVQMDVHLNVQNGQKMDKKNGQKMDRQIRGHISPPPSNGQSFIKEINLKGEFDSMQEVINPKKEEKSESEPKYKCGGCGGTFNERYKRCPHCGAEF